MAAFPSRPEDALGVGGHPWEQSVPQEGRATWVLPAFRRPRAWRSPHTEVTPHGRWQSVLLPGPSPLGIIFQVSGSLALSKHLGHEC